MLFACKKAIVSKQLCVLLSDTLGHGPSVGAFANFIEGSFVRNLSSVVSC